MWPKFRARRGVAVASLPIAISTVLSARSASAEPMPSDPLADVPAPRAADVREDELALEKAVTREALHLVAIAKSPALRAGAHRVRAIAASARADSSLPEPMLMADVWQVPVSRPWALGDAQMIMLSLSQSFPAPGVRGMREEARLAEARAEAALVRAEARELVRAVDQAFVDYAEATRRLEVRRRHRDVVARMLELSKARLPSSASLSDVAQAEVELARADIEIANEEQAVEVAQRKLNGLLAREPGAKLGPPILEAPSTSQASLEDVVARAHANRPELEALEHRKDAQDLAAKASDREATIPSFSVTGSYFPPSGMMREHGFGVGVALSLPWLWGGRRDAVTAAQERAQAEISALEAERVRVGSDAAILTTQVKRAEQQYLLLGERALPASLRARSAAEAGYAAGTTDLFAWLRAARAVVELEMEIVTVRAALDRALFNLDFAAGGRLPRAPLADFEGAEDAR